MVVITYNMKLIADLEKKKHSKYAGKPPLNSRKYKHTSHANHSQTYFLSASPPPQVNAISRTLNENFWTLLPWTPMIQPNKQFSWRQSCPISPDYKLKIVRTESQEVRITKILQCSGDGIWQKWKWTTLGKPKIHSLDPSCVTMCIYYNLF